MSQPGRPGWPTDLVPIGHPQFEQRLTGWLLDRCPPQAREQSVLRRHPRALLHLCLHFQRGALEGQRQAYATARQELAPVLEPDELGEALAGIEAVGHLSVSALREVELVAEALAGRLRN